MDNIELYINGSLCDTGKSFGIRLRRQMISPAELNAKDAQASYTVTLPLTQTNDRIFSYTSIEEITDTCLYLNISKEGAKRLATLLIEMSNE